MKRYRVVAILVFLVAGLIWATAPLAQDTGRGRPGAEEGDELQRHGKILDMSRRELDTLIRTCRAAGCTEEELVRMLALTSRAKLAGLPHEELLHKLQEGVAKNAPPEVIHAALEAKARTLKRAKDVVDTLRMRGWDTPDPRLAVKVVADALEAGAAPTDVIRAVLDGSPSPAGVPDVRQTFHRSRTDK